MKRFLKAHHYSLLLVVKREWNNWITTYKIIAYFFDICKSWYNVYGDFMELINIKGNTYCIKNATNIGIYKISDNEVYLIDTGNDKECGKKILRIIEEQGWSIKGIINTHSHADHIGGNKFIQDRTNCIILNNGTENDITNHPIFEPTCLYGGYPLNELKNKFILASESHSTLIDNNLPGGLESFSLSGHSLDMIGIKTSDEVYFIGDAICDENIINKYHLFFLVDVLGYLNTLEYLRSLKGIFVPSNGEISSNIDNFININKNKVIEITNIIYQYLNVQKTLEDIIKHIFDYYQIHMNINQYYLLSFVIRSYLTYLVNENKITYSFIDNIMYYQKKE